MITSWRMFHWSTYTPKCSRGQDIRLDLTRRDTSHIRTRVVLLYYYIYCAVCELSAFRSRYLTTDSGARGARPESDYQSRFLTCTSGAYSSSIERAVGSRPRGSRDVVRIAYRSPRCGPTGEGELSKLLTIRPRAAEQRVKY